MLLRLKELRTDRDIPQNTLAQELGISPSVLANWEAETALPRTRDLPRIATVLGVSISELFAGVSDDSLPVEGAEVYGC